MSIKKLLYIDDNRIDSQIENLKRKLKKKGIELQETFLNLGDDEFKKKDENEKTILNKEKIKDYIKQNYFNKDFDLVASDYDYTDEKLDGYSMLEWIKNESNSKKNRIRRAKFCLYSAQQDKVVKKFDAPEKVKKLIKLKIDDFINRNYLADELASILMKQDTKYFFEEHLISYLEKYPDYKFQSVYPKFKGKTLSEIADEIDKDQPNGIEFRKTLVELTISHLIKLNDFE